MDLLSDESGDEKELRINKRFATKYEATARFKELQRGKELLEDNESDSDASDEDEDGEALSAGIDVQIMKTINSIRQKDPSIYDANAKWFQQPEEESSSGSESENDDNTSKTHKKKTYKDILREQLLRDGADGEGEGEQPLQGFAKKNASMSYDPEQEKLRREFLASVDKNADSDDSDDDGGMLVTKGGRAAGSSAGSSSRALKEAAAQRALDEQMEKLATLSKARSGAEQAQDAFLLDYFKQQKWKGHDIQMTSGGGGGGHGHSDDSDPEGDGDRDVDDDEEVEKAENFESKYNFRFQELLGAGGGSEGQQSEAGLQGLQVTGHARHVEGSLRRVDDKRKLAREALRERKEHERRQKEEELRRLKNLKRKELQARLQKIAAVGGVSYEAEEEEEEDKEDQGPDDSKKKRKDKKKNKNKDKNRNKKGLVVDAAGLDEDWDPEAHEALMAAQFGDDYYGAEGADEDFGDDAEAHRYALEIAAEEAGLGWNGEEEEGAGGLGEMEDEAEVEVEAALPALSKSKRQRNREKKAARERGAAAGGLGMEDDNMEGLDEAALEELYALDYEDIIGGDTFCRFRYRSVPGQDFGLTVEDILSAEDKELNQFRSIKKYAAYRRGESSGSGRKEEQGDVGADAGSRHRYGGVEEDDQDEGEEKLSKKRKRLRLAVRERQAAEAARLAALEVPAAATKKAVAVTVAVVATNDRDRDGESSGDEGEGEGARQPGEKRKRKRKHKKTGSAAAAAETEVDATAEAEAEAATENKPEKKEKKSVVAAPVTAPAVAATTIAKVVTVGTSSDEIKKSKKKKSSTGHSKPKAKDPQDVRMSLYR